MQRRRAALVLAAECLPRLRRRDATLHQVRDHHEGGYGRACGADVPNGAEGPVIDPGTGRRGGGIQLAWDALQGVVDEVLPVDRETLERAKQLVLQYPTLPVRAAVHVATLQRHGIDTVLSFDPAFDRVPGLTRLR